MIVRGSNRTVVRIDARVEVLVCMHFILSDGNHEVDDSNWC